MRSIIKSAAIAGALIAAVTPANAFAQATTPSNMLIYGTITSSGSSGPAIAAGYTVDLVSISANQIVATGTVQDSTGVYSISASLAQATNGTLMTLELTANGSVYQLLNSGTPTSFAYQGNFPFPTSLGKNVTVGALISSPPSTATTTTTTTSTSTTATTGTTGATTTTGTASTTTGSAICPTTLPQCDANGDGVFNQADVDFVKHALGQHNPSVSADVNGDGVVNTRDLLDEMRALSTWQRDQILGTTGGSTN